MRCGSFFTEIRAGWTSCRWDKYKMLWCHGLSASESFASRDRVCFFCCNFFSRLHLTQLPASPSLSPLAPFVKQSQPQVKNLREIEGCANEATDPRFLATNEVLLHDSVHWHAWKAHLHIPKDFATIPSHLAGCRRSYAGHSPNYVRNSKRVQPCVA